MSHKVENTWKFLIISATVILRKRKQLDMQNDNEGTLLVLCVELSQSTKRILLEFM
jgi:hypothetical protein